MRTALQANRLGTGEGNAVSGVQDVPRPAEETGPRLERPSELTFPDRLTIPYIAGDGVGPEVCEATRAVLDRAIGAAYGGRRRIEWLETWAGKKALARGDAWLPEETVEAFRRSRVLLRGPMEVPPENSLKSPSTCAAEPHGEPHGETVDALLQRRLDLFAVVRPVRHLPGAPAPVRHPERIRLVIFRESTEDAARWADWPVGSEGARHVIAAARGAGAPLDDQGAVGVSVTGAAGVRRLMRKAIRHALDRGLPSVTVVHDSIFRRSTDGAFLEWALAVAREEFAADVVFEKELPDNGRSGTAGGRVAIKERSASVMFQQVLLRPSDYSVLVMTGVAGVHLTQSALAQAGAMGMAPGAKMGETHAVFEPTHGPHMRQAGLDQANPGSMILSGAMLLEHLGWEEAAGLVQRAVERAVVQKTVPADIERYLDGARRVSGSEFARIVAAHIA